MKKQIKRLISVLLIGSILSTFGVVNSFAEEIKGDNHTIADITSGGYSSYNDKISDKPNSTQEIVIDASGFIADKSNAVVDSNKGLITINSKNNTAVYSFTAQEDAVYNLNLFYYPTHSGTSDILIGIKIDGEYLFEETENLVCFRQWKNKTNEWRVDSLGDQFTSEQVQTDNLVKQTIFDDTGVQLDPYKFHLTKGKHTIEIILKEEEVSIQKIVFSPLENLKTYKDIEKLYKEKNYKEYGGKNIEIEAEYADFKNKNSLTAKADGNSPDVSPTSITKSVVNYIGGENWSGPGQELTWKIKVKESGLYKLGFSYKQSYVLNGSVYRWLKIDGETPFEEARSLSFTYKSGWQNSFFSDSNGNPYLFYLEEGEHTLSLSVTLGEMSAFYERLEKIVEALGDKYLEINMITGETPDSNRDYELFKQIPDLEEVLTKQYENLNKLTLDLETAVGSKTTQYTGAFKSMAKVIEQMLKTKYLAHTYKSDYYSKYVSLSSWLYDMKDMSLAMDKIYLTAPDAELLDGAGFWNSIWFHVRKFFASFVKDYSFEQNQNEQSIKIWINWGNDQAQVLSSLIQEDFTPKTGIKVKFELVNASIIQGILTNNQPDVVLHMEATGPVNYAMRGALAPLDEFDDYEEVLDRFLKDSEKQYSYKGRCYGLPDTQSFLVMFYRHDILEELGLQVPTTWDEYIECANVLQRHNMSAYIPTGVQTFATFMYQNNLKIYQDDLKQNILADKAAINVFEDFTNLYTQYKMPVTLDFYNRFRIGVTPLGIAPYTQYTTFKVASPEIEGKWSIAPIPATVLEDGTLNNSQCGTGTACCILNKSKNKDAAWEFLKWWTTADVQLKYSQNLESILGPVARVATATVDAFSRYSWNYGDKDILLNQWEKVHLMPQVPGSYHLTRSFDQAFLEVVNGENTANDAMVKWAASANAEIARKWAEYEN